jgi:DNA-binding NarL/FixJ family response regulator
MTTPYTKIKILLADDHEFFRDGFIFFIKEAPDIELVDTASNGKQLVQLAAKHLPDVILTDIKMPVMDGIEATKIITTNFPQIAIIALSMSNEENFIVEMIEAGAKGYLIKNAQKHEILEAIRTVSKHEFYQCQSTGKKFAELVARRLLDPKNPGSIKFSEKEKDIIRLICLEYSNKEIAAQLKINLRTIEGFRKRMIKKVNARNAVGLAMYAVRYNIFTTDK